MNKDKLKVLILVLICSGVFGFIYEFIFYYFNGGMSHFYWRGANFLPWIDIYALGSLLILILGYKHKKSPLKVFLISFLSCSILEYIAGELIYLIRDGYRAWNYNTEILSYGSINGFVCLRSALIFGFSGLILVYILVPICRYLATKKIIVNIGYILISIILIDEVYNLTIARLTSLPRACEIYAKKGIKFVDSNQKK